MGTERGFRPEQNLPIESKDAKNQLQQLNKELRRVFNKIRNLVREYNQSAGHIVFEPVRRGSTNITGLKHQIKRYNYSLDYPSESLTQILGLIEQASDIKEQRRLIRADLLIAREARRLAREKDALIEQRKKEREEARQAQEAARHKQKEKEEKRKKAEQEKQALRMQLGLEDGPGLHSEVSHGSTLDSYSIEYPLRNRKPDLSEIEGTPKDIMEKDY